MRRYEVTVEPQGSLFVGGYAENTGLSDGDTASDAEGLVLPGSAIHGALRESAERLLRGAEIGSGEVEEWLGKIFGDEGDHRTGGVGREGALRIGPLRPSAESDVGTERLTLRHHVSLTRATRQAASQRLFQNRVTPAGRKLEFKGVLEMLAPLDDDALALLMASVEITDQIGGGRGRGLGLVKMRLAELQGEDRGEREPLELGSGDEHTIVLQLAAREPLRLGGIKDQTNVLKSKDHLDGSVVRGAVAAVLVRESSPAVETVLGGEKPAAFGDARAGSADAIPAPLTLRVPKRAQGDPEDVAVHLCAERLMEDAGSPLPEKRSSDHDFLMKPAKGTFAPVAGGWEKIRLQRRTVTRSARNALTGRSDDGRLFSLELLDPLQKPADAAEQLRFYAPVTGAPEQLEAVVDAARELLVGGVRTRGFGRVELEKVIVEPTLPPVEERHARWVETVGALAGGLDAAATGVVLALGPVALDGPTLHQALDALGLEAIDGRTRRQIHGGWNRSVNLPRMLAGCFIPGSVWIVRTTDGQKAAGPLARLETEGLGPGRPDGWGRVVACHPIHLDCLKENAA